MRRTAAGVHAAAARPLRPAWHPAHRRRGAIWLWTHRQDVRLRAHRRRSRHHDAGQVDRLRSAAERGGRHLEVDGSVGVGRARLDLRWESGVVFRRHRDPRCLYAGACAGERDGKGRPARQPAARAAAADAGDWRGPRPRVDDRYRIGDAGGDSRQGPAEEDSKGMPRFRHGGVELRPARQRAAAGAAAQYFASRARRRMGDLEWGVSGGGRMSQTMTSERGQKTEAKTYKNYIGGDRGDTESGRTLNSPKPPPKNPGVGGVAAGHP